MKNNSDISLVIFGTGKRPYLNRVDWDRFFFCDKQQKILASVTYDLCQAFDHKGVTLYSDSTYRMRNGTQGYLVVYVTRVQQKWLFRYVFAVPVATIDHQLLLTPSIFHVTTFLLLRQNLILLL